MEPAQRSDVPPRPRGPCALCAFVFADFTIRADGDFYWKGLFFKRGSVTTVCVRCSITILDAQDAFGNAERTATKMGLEPMTDDWLRTVRAIVGPELTAAARHPDRS